MTETCDVLMSRVPVRPDGTTMRGHLQACGRPVFRDGLCAFHVRSLEAVPDRSIARRIRAALKRW